MGELQLQDYRRSVVHALGGDAESIWTDEDTTHDHLIHMAMRHLYGLHPWNWRRRGPIELEFTTDVEFVDVPTDFGQITGLEASNGITYNVFQATPERIRQLRSRTNSDSGTIYYAGITVRQRDTHGSYSSRRQLYYWPTSTTLNVQIIYMARYEDLVDPQHSPGLDDRFQWLATRLVEAFAKEQEDDEMGLIDRVSESAMVQRLKEEDGMEQRDLGPMTGGSLQATTMIVKPWKEIRDPS